MVPKKSDPKPRVIVQLSNRWAKFFVEDPDILVNLKKHFSYPVEGAEWSPNYSSREVLRPGEWDGRHHMLRYGKVGTGLFLELKTELDKQFQIVVADQRAFPEFHPEQADEKTREYQREGITAMVAASNTGGLVLSATGTGKTFLLGRFFKRLKGAAIFVVDELALLRQAKRELEAALNEPVGTVGSGVFAPQRITVVMIQTLSRHQEESLYRQWFKLLEVVVLDEFHVQINERTRDMVTAIKAKAVFGLTATLNLENPEVWMNAMALTGPVVFNYTLKQGVDEGFLSKGKVCLVRLPNTTPVGSKDPELSYRVLVTHCKMRNACIEALIREGVRRDRRVIAIVERMVHLQILSRRLEDLPHNIVCGAYSVKEREASKRQMISGEVRVILASRVFSRGIDIPNLDTTIDATGFPSQEAAVQRYGRGTRLSEGKQFLHFDISDRMNTFADAADSRQEALQKVGIPLISVQWDGDVKRIYDRCLRKEPEAASGSAA